MQHSFYNIFDAFDEAVVICRNGRAVYANSAAAALYGTELCGRSSEDIFGVLGSGTGARSGSVSTPRGLCLAHAIPYGEDQIYKISGSGGDDALVNLADSFSASLRSAATQQRFASDIIRQYTVGIDDPQFTDCVSIHEHNNYRIAKDAENIAFLGSAGGYFESDTNFEVIALTKDIIVSLPAFLPGRRVELTAVPAQAVFVQGDPVAFERILLNLISNAVKYSPADSTVNINLSTSGTRVRLHVQDSGCGIAPERLSTVFSTWRMPRPLTDPKAGLGLGLHVVHCLTQRFDGTVMIESKVPGGTAVTVDLPVAQGLTLRESGSKYMGFDSRILTDLSDILPAESYKAKFLD